MYGEKQENVLDIQIHGDCDPQIHSVIIQDKWDITCCSHTDYTPEFGFSKVVVGQTLLKGIGGGVSG